MGKITDEDLRQMLKTLTKGPMQVFPAEVISVDLEEYTIDVKPAGQAELLDVRLKAGIDEFKDGVVEVPSEGSSVLIGIIGNDRDTAYVVKTSQVDKVIINGGELGGLIKIEELKTQLGKYNQLLQAVIGVLNGAPIPEPGSNAPSALQAALKAAVAGKQLPTYDDIEDDKVIH